MSTFNLYADDMVAARDWYTEMLGVAPYYAHEVDGHPAYLEWRVGDHLHELGVIDARWAPPDRSTAVNVIVHWCVDDVRAALQRLLDLGATPVLPVTEQGPGFVTASVRDPFGNVLGVMENAHFHDVLAGWRDGVGPSGLEH